MTISQRVVLRGLWCCLSLFLLLPASLPARPVGKVSGAVDVSEWISTHFGKGKLPPFSFFYGDKPSDEFIRKWQYKAEKLTAHEKGVVSYLYTYRDPATGLQVECQVKGFEAFGAVEWVMNFTNTSGQNTPKIRDVRVVDYAVEYPQEGFHLLRMEGVHCFGSRADFRPHYEELVQGKPIEVYPDLLQGRSSDENAMPFFNLVSGKDRGVVMALGWTGTWTATFTREQAGQASISSGMHTMNLLLYPGEAIRTPSVCLLFWQGEDLMSGQNTFRQFVLAHHSPQRNGQMARPPLASAFNPGDPAPCAEQCCVTEEYLLAMLNRIKLFGLTPEVFWLDAGWYKGCGPNDPGKDWGNLGNWVPDPERFPRGLKPISDAAHAAGARFLLWFEPERVQPDMMFSREHPDFMSKRPDRGYFLFDLGNPKAVDWLCQYIGDFIEESGVDIYRQDACIYPGYWWRANDTADRIGISEIRHIEGLYKYWDYLLARFPNLMIDNCAGGGCRLDLETISRSIPLWRSDYEPGEPNGAQNIAYGINFFLPLNGTGIFNSKAYDVRSCLASGTVLNWKVTDRSSSIPDMQKAMKDIKELRDYYYGDYYPLSGMGDLTSDDTWLAYQLDLPAQQKGIVLAFRRDDNIEPTYSIQLRGLEAQATYEVYDEDKNTTLNYSGAQLLTGLPLKLDDAHSSVLLRYKRVK